jgi:hypothetical protein
MSSEKRITIAYHGHCFDGMASAALLSRFLRSRYEAPVSFRYHGLDHQPGGSYVPEEVLDGEINAVVDFRYTTSSSLHWFFDHHVTGIVDEQERAHLEADRSGQKFFEPQYGSCCQLIADVARDQFGWKAPELTELVRWADVIDAARFPSAEVPVELQEPALQLMTVIEAHGDTEFLAPRIRKLADGVPLSEIASDPEIQERFRPLKEQHRQTLAAIRETARCDEGVVTFELVGEGRDRYNKFIPYWLFPESRYCVAVVGTPRRVKISVGSNPWSPVPRAHDISSLCARYGGGGHPVVGAISLPPDQLERGREIAAEVIGELRQG